ncbi:LamG domain-containing protein, partial [bacterium]|nr:LamG domain-containing protein [bacterium]
YLSVPDSDDWDFTGDFTIDLWARWTSLGVDTLVANTEATATTKGFWWNYNNAGSLVFYFANDDGGSPWDISVVHAWTPSVDIWHHLAVVRDSGTITQYVDGISIGSTAGQSLSISSDNTLRVAADNLGTSDISGFLDELRISKGVARWTSNFTPPQRQYGSNTVATDESNIIMEGSGSMKLELGKSQIDGNTTALWHFEETGTTEGTTLYDATTNNNDATTTSNPAVVDGIFGKARLFDGVDDYLTVDDSADWDIVASSGDFTIDFWVNHTVTPTGSNGHYLGQYQDANNFWRLYYNGSSEGVKFYVDADGITDISLQGSGVGQLPDSWNYIAVVKNGNDYAIYTNGVQTATVTSSETANFTGQLEIGSATGQTNFTDGAIDELRIMKGYGMSADEVAEAYRLGANHKISRDITVQDFSASTTMPFWVAGDELGTYLEATIGESAWANYDSATTSTSTVLFIHGDEITDSTSIKDSSISSHTITANGNAKITASGKIGNAMTFDGTGDYLEIPDSDDWQFGGASGGDWTMSGWVLLSTLPSSNYKFMSQYVVDGTQWYFALVNNSGTYTWEFIVANGAGDIISSNKNLPSAPSVDTWYHVAIVRSGDDYSTWWNGAEIGTVNTDTDNMPNFAAPLAIGKINVQTYWNGNLDEIRILNTAMTQAEIRQAYEYGARAHPITIDFKASLQPSDLIADSSDTQFAITATTTGLSATTTGLYIGDKIIVKENVSGTEYLAQGTATTTNTTTGVVNVDQWDTGSTFPSGGYTQYATVFKWQREYMPLGGILDSHIDAVERITIRPTNGAGGRTVYLDDFRGSSGFLTASSSEAITSGDNRYFQYRTIYTTADTAVSPYMTAMTVNYTLSANSTPSVIGISGGGFLSF